MAIGRLDGLVMILSTETKGVLRILEGGHVKSITSVAWSPFNRFLASASLDWNVIVWDLKDCTRALTIRFDAPVTNVQFSPITNKVLVVILQTQQAFLIDQRRASRISSTVSKTELGIESGDAGSILSATISADGEFIVLGTSKGDLLILHLDSQRLIQRVNNGSSGIREVALDKSVRTLVTNSNDRAVRLYSFASTKPAANDYDTPIEVNCTLQHKFQDLINRTPWSGIGFSGDGEYVFGGATHKAAHNIYIWDRGAGVLDKILQGPRDSLVNVDWHPNRPMLASVSHTGAINVWFNMPTEIWSAYAPGFEELEENIVYEEREDEFDLEDEEEVTRRKKDEEEAHVDILSLGPQQSVLKRKKKQIVPGKHVQDRMEIDEEKMANSNSESQFEEDDFNDDDDEAFAIPVRISLDVPDLEVDQD
jgi:COMPASS component SWD1